MIHIKEAGANWDAKNVGYCQTDVVLKNGMGVTLNLPESKVELPTSATVKGDLWLVMNRIDKPETHSPNEYKIEPGEHPRCFRLKSLDQCILEMDDDVLESAYQNVAKGDFLVYNTKGNMATASDHTGYRVWFEVIEKNSYNGNGLKILVHAE